ncbi:MAG: glycosyltransferase, partial [Acidimicrobiia bacterium]|nr:glycosyltransferase [Acidimicrobiia bacterium]
MATDLPPVRILELRSVRGTGGGPEKTILRGTASTDAGRFAITLCYLLDARDGPFALAGAARDLKLDYVEVRERHALDRRAWAELRRITRERRIDIVHAHDYKTDLLALWLARREGIVPLSTAHGWTGHHVRERWLYYPADRWLLRRFPRVIAVSDQIRDALVTAGCNPDRVTTVLNGIDPAAFRRDAGRRLPARHALGVPDTACLIGSLGRVEPQKRFDLLLDAFARLSSRHPGLWLVVAGEGSERPNLAAQATRLGVADRVRLLGHRSDVIDVLHALDLFVQSSDYEGTPNAVLEAMAVETPVVATTAGGTGQLIDDGVHGLLVPAGSSAQLAEAIEAALLDPDGMAVRAVAARRRVEDELSFAARMRAVERIYEELANRR